MARVRQWTGESWPSSSGSPPRFTDFEGEMAVEFPDEPFGNTSNFRALPEELCVRIFRYLRPVEDHLPVLGLVCRKWREILRRASILWRHIHVDPTNYSYWHFSLLSTIFRLYGHHVHILSWKDNAPVYESIFALIPKLMSLKRLRLPVLWTRAVVESLAPLSRLEKIHIHGGFAITDAELDLISRQFPNLRTVSLNGCWSITTAGVTRFVQSLPSLRTVKLKVNSNLRLSDLRSEQAMTEGARMPQGLAESPCGHLLSVLCLHFVPIEMEHLWAVVSRLSGLKKLSISNCESLHAIRIRSDSLQKIYLFNLWSVLFVSIAAPNLRLLNIDHGLESMEHLEVFAPKLRRMTVDGSNVLRTIQVRSDKLVFLQIYHCEELEMRSLKEALAQNTSIACLKIGRLSQENLSLDETSCPSLRELCLLSDFACNALHVRSPTLRLIHTESEVDLTALNHLYVVANHLCKIALVGVPALRSIIVQCVSVDAIELNLCSDDQICLESCVIQALSSIGFLRLFDCQVNLLVVNTPLARTVVLYRCQMSDYALQMALTGCPNIAHLNLEKCRSLTSVNINAPPMKYLNMFGCTDVHRLDLDCPQLIGLNLGLCSKMRLFINGVEEDLTSGCKGIDIVLPEDPTRWSHDFPPEPYVCS